MKITRDLLRQLITEEINIRLTEETEEQQRNTAVDQISTILGRLHHTNINAQDVLNQSKEKYENNVDSEKPKDMSDEDAIDEASAVQQSIDMGLDHSKESDDHEGSMAKRQMFKTAMDSKAILDMLDDDDNLPAWIQSKLTKIADYIGVVKNYLQYDEATEMAGNRKEKKWSDADHDKQEKIAKEIEKENPGISKQKKMAYAGAQVNREKRKRNK
jgi:hypothetical protein